MFVLCAIFLIGFYSFDAMCTFPMGYLKPYTSLPSTANTALSSGQTNQPTLQGREMDNSTNKQTGALSCPGNIHNKQTNRGHCPVRGIFTTNKQTGGIVLSG